MLRTAVRQLLLCAVVFIGHEVQAQLNIMGSVLDSTNRQPLPYAAIGILHRGEGTLANEDGNFTIRVSPTDTLQIYLTGYKRRFITVAALQRNPRIVLSPSQFVLREVVVKANDALYQEVLACRKAELKGSFQQSRAYFLLQSDLNGQPAEMMECYYNARLDGLNVQGLDFKNGRSGLAEFNGRLFLNLNLSRAFLLGDLFREQDHVPVSPLQLKSRDLHRNFNLELKTSSDDIDVIAFTPRRGIGYYYYGELWIQKKQPRLLKMVLNVDNAKVHPFTAWHDSSGRIENVTFRQEMLFDDRSEKHRPVQSVLSYSMTYHSFRQLGLNDTTLQVNANAVLFFFNFDHPFVPLHFDFDPAMDDYKKIAGLTYNDDFWSQQNSFTTSSAMQRRLRYIRQHGTLINYSALNALHEKGPVLMMYHNYLLWSGEKRLLVKGGHLGGDSMTALPPGARDRRYNMSVQLFMDINESPSGWTWHSRTILDHYKSYCLLESSPEINCTMNMYFDLYEMGRREMEKELALHHGSLAEIKSIYNKYVRTLKEQGDLFLDEVKKGTDRYHMKIWNEKIMEVLQVDNLERFGIKNE